MQRYWSALFAFGYPVEIALVASYVHVVLTCKSCSNGLARA